MAVFVVCENSRGSLHPCLLTLLTQALFSEPSILPKSARYTHNHEKSNHAPPTRAPRTNHLRLRRLRLAKCRQMRPAVPRNQRRLRVLLQKPSQRRHQIPPGRYDDPITLGTRRRWPHRQERQPLQSRGRELLFACPVPALQVLHVAIAGYVRQHQEQVGIPHAALRRQRLPEVHHRAAIELGEDEDPEHVLPLEYRSEMRKVEGGEGLYCQQVGLFRICCSMLADSCFSFLFFFSFSFLVSG